MKNTTHSRLFIKQSDQVIAIELLKEFQQICRFQLPRKIRD